MTALHPGITRRRPARRYAINLTAGQIEALTAVLDNGLAGPAPTPDQQAQVTSIMFSMADLQRSIASDAPVLSVSPAVRIS